MISHLCIHFSYFPLLGMYLILFHNNELIIIKKLTHAQKSYRYMTCYLITKFINNVLFDNILSDY